MLVNKLDLDVLLLMLCRLRFCKSFQSDNYVYYDLNNSALRRISCHGRNHSQASWKYSLTIFLCCQHQSECSLLGLKFSTKVWQEMFGP